MKELPEITERIKKLIAHFNDGNVSKFALKLNGISQQRLNRIFKKDKRTGKYPGVSDKILNAILEQYPVNPGWLMKGEGEMLADDLSPPMHIASEPEEKYVSQNDFGKMRIALKYNKKPVPVMNTKAAAGSITFYNDEPELVVEYLDMPFVGNADGAIEVVGDSMAPTLKNGSRVAVVKIEDISLIHPGNIYYIIDANYDGVVKRLYYTKDKSSFKLNSDNPDKDTYPPYEIPLSKIIAIFKVKADITKH